MAANVVTTLGKIQNLLSEKAAFGNPDWTLRMTSTNSANVAVIAAATDGLKAPVQHFLDQFTVSASATTTAATSIQVLDGSTVIWQSEIGLAAPVVPVTVSFSQRPLRATPGNSLSVTVGAFGTGIVTTVSVVGFSNISLAAFT